MSPSRVAVVERRWLFDPASGSVIANAIFSPAASAGSHCCFWSSVPKRAISSPQIAADTRISSSGQPCAASSSHTIASSLMPPPPPPYSGGRCTREEAVVGDRLPELVGLAAGARLLGEVLVAELRREVAHRGPQHLVLGALGEVHRLARSLDALLGALLRRKCDS